MTDVYTELLQENSELETKVLRLEQENKELKEEIDDLLEKKPDCNDEFGCQELIELKQENRELKLKLETIKKHCEEKLELCNNCHTLDCDNCIYGKYRGYEEILDILNEQQSSNIR